MLFYATFTIGLRYSVNLAFSQFAREAIWYDEIKPEITPYFADMRSVYYNEVIKKLKLR